MSRLQTKSDPRGRNRRRGAVTIEASLILPLFLMFWFGIIDLGISFFMREALVHQVHAAARYAIVNDLKDNDDETNKIKIRNMLLHNDPNSTLGNRPWFSLGDVYPTIDLLGSAATNDQCVRITIPDYQWFHFTPFLPAGTYHGKPITVVVPVEDKTTGG